MREKSLRSSILQLAVEGRLVPQDATEEPASELMARIRDERRRLVAAGKAKAPKGGESVIYRGEDGSWYERRGKGEPRCIDKEMPFDIPDSWEWTRLGELIQLQSGVDLSSGEYNDAHDGIPYITGASNFVDGKVLENRWTSYPRRVAFKGDLLFTCKGTVGKMGLCPFQRAHIARQVMSIRPVKYRTLGYLRLYLDEVASVIQAGAKGVIPGIERKTLLLSLVPLPPLAEQRRIVAKVDELMPLVEEYRQLEEERERVDSELPGRLRKSVLQLAVEGRLVPQDATEEPASELMARIRDERRRLVAAGKAKAPKGGESVIYRGEDGSWYERRGKGEPRCIDKEMPFDIPDSWEWTRLGELIQLQSGVDLSSGEYNDAHDGIPYITGASNFVDGKVLENRWTSYPRRVAFKGDLLFTCKGTVGKMGLCPFQRAHIARQVMSIRPVKYRTLGYLRLYLDEVASVIQAGAKGVIPGIERKTLLLSLVPLPPLAEQRRIVAKVDELMPLVGEYGCLEEDYISGQEC